MSSNISDYVGKNTISSSELYNMFFETTSSMSKYVWLRSANAIHYDAVFGVDGYSGYLGNGFCNDATGVRPAFTLDLSKLG